MLRGHDDYMAAQKANVEALDAVARIAKWLREPVDSTARTNALSTASADLEDAATRLSALLGETDG